MEEKRFQYLMEPIRIGTMTVKNRIVFPPMNTNLTSEDGCVTPDLEEYYLRRARGGAGLIILEAASVSKDSRNHPRQPMICDGNIPHPGQNWRKSCIGIIQNYQSSWYTMEAKLRFHRGSLHREFPSIKRTREKS